MAEIDNAVMANIAAFLERLKAAGMQIVRAVESCGYICPQLCSPEELGGTANEDNE